jgi:hypothetical protein
MMYATDEYAMPEVCPDGKDSVTFCTQCGIRPAKRKFCGDACRQAAYRKSAAHTACLARDRNWRRARKLAHGMLRNRDRYIGSLPVISGPGNDAVPRLGQFWISPDGKRMNFQKDGRAA